MTTRALSIVLMAAMVCACGSAPTMAWSKPDATRQEFIRTRSQCQTQSEGTTLILGGTLDGGRDERFQSCMKANGWVLINRPGGSAVSW